MIAIRLTKKGFLMMNGRTMKNSNTRWYTIFRQSICRRGFERGHEVTLTEPYGTNQEVFLQWTHLSVTEMVIVSSLENRKWAVVDTWVFFRITLEMLRSALKIILDTIYSISSLSVYKGGFRII